MRRRSEVASTKEEQTQVEKEKGLQFFKCAKCGLRQSSGSAHKEQGEFGTKLSCLSCGEDLGEIAKTTMTREVRLLTTFCPTCNKQLTLYGDMEKCPEGHVHPKGSGVAAKKQEDLFKEEPKHETSKASASTSTTVPRGTVENGKPITGLESPKEPPVTKATIDAQATIDEIAKEMDDVFRSVKVPPGENLIDHVTRKPDPEDVGQQVSVSWGEEVIQVTPFCTYRVGPFYASTTIRPGERRVHAIARLNRDLSEYAELEHHRKRKAFIKELKATKAEWAKTNEDTSGDY